MQFKLSNMMDIVKTSYYGSSDNELVTKAGTVVSNMEKSEDFPEPKPTWGVLSEQYKAYVDAVMKAKSGDRVLIATKNAAKNVFCESLQRTAFYVNMIAMGVPEKLLLSGLELVKPGSPVVLSQPTDVSVTNLTNPGSVMGKVGNKGNARSLIVQYTADPVTDKSVWQSKGTTRKSCTIAGLPVGTRIWFRVVGVGKNEEQMVSDVVSIIITG